MSSPSSWTARSGDVTPGYRCIPCVKLLQLRSLGPRMLGARTPLGQGGRETVRQAPAVWLPVLKHKAGDAGAAADAVRAGFMTFRKAPSIGTKERKLALLSHIGRCNSKTSFSRRARMSPGSVMEVWL